MYLHDKKQNEAENEITLKIQNSSDRHNSLLKFNLF